MIQAILPPPHPDPHVDATRRYITSVVLELVSRDIMVSRSWLDPREPRDATVLLAGDTHALVWDEETGWRSGMFVSGRQGVRTILTDCRWLAGGVLPPATDLVDALLEERFTGRVVHRRHTDMHDGFEEDLLHVDSRALAHS